MGRGRRTWGPWLVGVAAAVALGGCSGDDESAATVFVDYEHDEFATQFIRYFPEELQIHPGDSVTFKQYWTGEPHTVTFGTAVGEVLEVTRPLLAEWGDKPESEVPPEVLEEYFAAEMSLPSWYGPPEGEGEPPEGGEDGPPPEGGEDGPPPEEGEDGPPPEEGEDTEDEGGSEVPPPLPQALAQPCLIADGEVPEDPVPPCEERELRPFQGTETYYNSGIIPYEGPGGNEFTFTTADTIAPGEYGFYCAVHGSFQSGVIEVVPEDQPIQAADELAVELRTQVNETLAPYETTFAGALQGEYRYAGQEHDWNYAGLLREDEGDIGIINEFVPDDVRAAVDEPVTWRMFGPHSISFDVPEYFPIVEFLDDGTVRTNEAIYEPAGGAPEVPEPDPPPGIEGDEGPPPEPEPLVVDGGAWDGSGFWSSGVLYSDAYVEYTLRVSTPGTYRFACLIHPPMVGTLTVTE